jgi:hypothetical protein
MMHLGNAHADDGFSVSPDNKCGHVAASADSLSEHGVCPRPSLGLDYDAISQSSDSTTEFLRLHDFHAVSMNDAAHDRHA